MADDGKTRRKPAHTAKGGALTARATCLCGAVVVETGVPAVWAWHDHAPASRRAHGAAYATYVGCWKSKTRLLAGEAQLTRYDNAASGHARSFCKTCGTPVFYERPRAPKMVKIPRALFDGRVGREPRYHLAIEELRDWAWLGERLTPLKGYPGVVWTGGRRKKTTLPPP